MKYCNERKRDGVSDHDEVVCSNNSNSDRVQVVSAPARVKSGSTGDGWSRVSTWTHG